MSKKPGIIAKELEGCGRQKEETWRHGDMAEAVVKPSQRRGINWNFQEEG